MLSTKNHLLIESKKIKVDKSYTFLSTAFTPANEERHILSLSAETFDRDVEKSHTN